jgi:hypothetical protein
MTNVSLISNCQWDLIRPGDLLISTDSVIDVRPVFKTQCGVVILVLQVMFAVKLKMNLSLGVRYKCGESETRELIQNSLIF